MMVVRRAQSTDIRSFVPHQFLPLNQTIVNLKSKIMLLAWFLIVYQFY